MTTLEKVTLGVLGTAMFAGVGYLSYQTETDPDRSPTWVREQQKAAAAAEFAAFRGQFGASVAGWMADASLTKAASASEPMPKAVLIDSNLKAVDEAHMALPVPLRAARPAEVRTLVFLDWGSRQVLTYASGDKGFIRTCTVKVVDATKHALITQATFEGGPPKEMKRLGSGDQYGDKPVDAILNFVTTSLAAASGPGKPS